MKKLFSVFLSLIVTLVPLLSVSAESSIKDDCPVIYIHGFMASDLYSDKNDPESEKIWPIPSESIVSAVKNASPYIAEFAFNKDWDSFAEKTFSVVSDLFAPLCCDINGNITDNSGAYFVYPDKAQVTKNGRYSFTYDWRLDPLILAQQLNDFIDYILECSGASKVSLFCHSFGGVITVSYLSLYGNEKIDGVCFYSSAPYGETYNGELMSGHISVNSGSFTQYMSGLLSDSDYPYLFDTLFEILDLSGALDPVCDCVNYTVDKVLTIAAKKAILPIFAGWLPIWSMIPDEYFESSYNYVFNTIYKDDGIDRSEIISKINEYNTKVKVNREKTLRDLNEKANLIVISGYNFASVPLVESWEYMSDNTIDTKNTSFGATTASYYGVLNEEYLSKVDPKYINPEKNIDASTCMFPEQTWFIKNLKHTASSGCLDEMVYTLLLSKEQPTVNTYPQYPRFTIYSPQNDTVTPYEYAEKLSLLDKIILAIKDLYKLIVNLINNK